jgi:prevent-host-death family protein
VPQAVGIRELRQNLSRYVRRVVAGERFVVTDRRRPVALLLPWVDESDPLERLIAEGRAKRGHGSLLDFEPLSPPASAGTRRALGAERTERLG